MNKLLCALLIFLLFLLPSCSESYEDYNWAMKNVGQKVCGEKGVAGMDIGADNSSLNWNGKPMIIAIVDSGVSSNDNPALNGIVVNSSEGERNDVHALAVTGIISTNSQSTYKSVLKDAPIYNIAIDKDNINISKLINDLNIAENCGVRLVNMSFTMNYFCQELFDYIQKSNMIFVCAAGNIHENHIAYPAGFDLDNIISVVGINNWGYCSQFSNYSNYADIAAPGENILCLDQNGNLSYYSGTSFATPYVTACCAYLISETNCSALDAKKILLECAVDNPALKGYVCDSRMLSLKNINLYIEKCNKK